MCVYVYVYVFLDRIVMGSFIEKVLFECRPERVMDGTSHLLGIWMMCIPGRGNRGSAKAGDLPSM